MNRVYPTMLSICVVFLVAIFPRVCSGQCMCGVNQPATPITYTATLVPTTVSTATIAFPMFNPAIGTLACVGLQDTVTVTSTLHVSNTAPDTVDYKFNLDVGNDIEGPGNLSATSDSSMVIKDTLAGKNLPGSWVINGPYNFFTNHVDSNGTSSTSGYLGSPGSWMNFTYDITGGLTVTKGGQNYADTIQTVYGGQFRLTYYWCPSVVLATDITNFTAVPSGDHIQLQWLSTNEQNNTNYEIQVSTDGQNFTTVGLTESNPASAGTTTKYQYQYNPDQATVGKLYFRIKETNANGQVTYSAILVVTPGSGSDDGPVSYQIYPNPAAGSLFILFNKNQTARYLLQLVNTAGQVIQENEATLTGTSQIRLDLSPQPAKGLYFLRTIDQTHNQSYVSKVFIN